MKRSTKIFVLILLSVLIAPTLWGCAAGDKTPETTPPAPQQGGNVPNTEAAFDTNSLTLVVDQWAKSGHSNVKASPNGRDGCIACHDGHAFANKITELAKMPETRVIKVDDQTIAAGNQSCESCHVGYAVELMKDGKISIPTAENLQVGKSALCYACHNSRRAPKADDENRAAPHYGAQADVVTGTGGLKVEGFSYKNSPHATIENGCITCHMPVGEGDRRFADHSFELKNEQAAKICGTCHSGITGFNMAAKADYDGDGNTEGFQDEVEGLMASVKKAVEEKIEGGTFKGGGGKINFETAQGTPIEPTKIEDDVYFAAYNWYLINSDNSKGVHNPSFVVQLLQQSYKKLTGKDVPGATMSQ